MKSVPKLIRRFVGILLLSSILLITLNIVLLVVFTMSQISSLSGGVIFNSSTRRIPHSNEA